MELLLFVKKEDYMKMNDILLKDDIVSRASVDFKDAKILGIKKEGFYCLISGLEIAYNKAKELASGKAEVVEGKEKEEVLKKIKEEKDAALAGFGGVMEF